MQYTHILQDQDLLQKDVQLSEKQSDSISALQFLATFPVIMQNLIKVSLDHIQAGSPRNQ